MMKSTPSCSRRRSPAVLVGAWALLVVSLMVACGSDEPMGDADDDSPTSTGTSGCMSPPHPWHSGVCIFGDGCGSCMRPGYICDGRLQSGQLEDDEWAACICGASVCADACQSACAGEPGQEASNLAPLATECHDCLVSASEPTGACSFDIECGSGGAGGSAMGQ